MPAAHPVTGVAARCASPPTGQPHGLSVGLLPFALNPVIGAVAHDRLQALAELLHDFLAVRQQARVGAEGHVDAVDVLRAASGGHQFVGDDAGIEYWTRFRLEPEFLAVVLGSLVHSGDLIVSITGKKLDASAVDQFAKLSIAELAGFKHIERPRDLPLGPIQDLFELLGLPKGLIVNPAKRDDAVTQLQAKVAELVQRLASARSPEEVPPLRGQLIEENARLRRAIDKALTFGAQIDDWDPLAWATVASILKGEIA